MDEPRNPFDQFMGEFEKVSAPIKLVIRLLRQKPRPAMNIETKTVPPKSSLEKVFEGAFWGLSGFALNVLMTLVMQFYGVDDPSIARWLLIITAIWILFAAARLLRLISPNKEFRILGSVVCLILIVLISYRVDNWAMGKRAQRRNPLTKEEFLDFVKNPSTVKQLSSSTTDTTFAPTKTETKRYSTVQVLPSVSYRDLRRRLNLASDEINALELKEENKVYPDASLLSWLFRTRYLENVRSLRDECANAYRGDAELNDTLSRIQTMDEFYKSHNSMPEPLIYPADIDNIYKGLARLAAALPDVVCQGCSQNEIYERTIKLADKISGVYVDYMTKMKELAMQLKQSKDSGDSAEKKRETEKEIRSSVASASLFAIKRYEEKYRDDALNYRETIFERSSEPGIRNDSLLEKYESPSSPLDIFEISSDLQRLAGTIKSEKTTTIR